MEFVGVSMEILSGRSKHKYLGKTLVGDFRHRTEVELGHRLQVTCAKFHKHIHMLSPSGDADYFPGGPLPN
jgi:hypothetical protein